MEPCVAFERFVTTRTGCVRHTCRAPTSRQIEIFFTCCGLAINSTVFEYASTTDRGRICDIRRSARTIAQSIGFTFANIIRPQRVPSHPSTLHNAIRTARTIRIIASATITRSLTSCRICRTGIPLRRQRCVGRFVILILAVRIRERIAPRFERVPRTHERSCRFGRKLCQISHILAFIGTRTATIFIRNGICFSHARCTRRILFIPSVTCEFQSTCGLCRITCITIVLPPRRCLCTMRTCRIGRALLLVTLTCACFIALCIAALIIHVGQRICTITNR